MSAEPTYVVTGATGNVGAEVVAALHDRGHHVRAVTRAASRIESAPGVEVVVGDLDEPASLYDAVVGATGIFLLPGYDGAADLLAHARSSGVERVVLRRRVRRRILRFLRRRFPRRIDGDQHRAGGHRSSAGHSLQLVRAHADAFN